MASKNVAPASSLAIASLIVTDRLFWVSSSSVMRCRFEVVMLFAYEREERSVSPAMASDGGAVRYRLADRDQVRNRVRIPTLQKGLCRRWWPGSDSRERPAPSPRLSRFSHFNAIAVDRGDLGNAEFKGCLGRTEVR